MTAAFDRHMMMIALAMARRGLGSTSPNPSVGAVIADETTGEVIARGWTQPGGRPHAEREALRRAGNRARGKTMYVTLEPCAHTGRTPTCSDSIVEAGIARVVCALPDPNPIVAGHGFAQLADAGIKVDVGLMGDEARWVTLGHILRQTARRPFVQLKAAFSRNGLVPRGRGSAPVFVTGEEARAYAHILRAEADAILIGIGTALADDPDLTCRLPGLAVRSPVRVVLDSRLALPPDSRLARSAREVPVWVFCAADSPGQSVETLRALGVRVIDKLAPRPTDSDRLDAWRGEQVPAILRILAREGITRLLVEGGPGVARAFERATGEDDTPPPLSVVDEYVVIHGHRDIDPADGIRVDFGGAPGHRPFGMGLLPSEAGVPMRKLGDDLLWSVRRRR